MTELSDYKRMVEEPQNRAYEQRIQALLSELATLKIKADFWENEYESITNKAVDVMADLGHVVDPAEKMIEAANYRLNKKLNKPTGGA